MRLGGWALVLAALWMLGGACHRQPPPPSEKGQEPAVAAAPQVAPVAAAETPALQLPGSLELSGGEVGQPLRIDLPGDLKPLVESVRWLVGAQEVQGVHELELAPRYFGLDQWVTAEVVLGNGRHLKTPSVRTRGIPPRLGAVEMPPLTFPGTWVFPLKLEDPNTGLPYLALAGPEPIEVHLQDPVPAGLSWDDGQQALVWTVEGDALKGLEQLHELRLDLVNRWGRVPYSLPLTWRTEPAPPPPATR